MRYVVALIVIMLAGCENKSLPESTSGSALPKAAGLHAGFGKTDITPTLIEGYVDANGNGHYDTGEETIDENGNGIWEPVWIAGFGNSRAATGVHDPLWARSMAMYEGGELLVITVLDLVGMLPTRMIDIRDRVIAEVGHDFALKPQSLLIATTHTHESPDGMGIWGEAPGISGINEEYMQYVVEQSAISIIASLRALEPARVRFGYATAATDINADSRYPFVIDDDIYSAQFINAAGKTIGSFVEYSMHPEVLWSRNTLLTSDYPHFLREKMEKELGGISVFATGNVGGLMTPQTDNHTFEEAEKVGVSLAESALESLAKESDRLDCDLKVASVPLLLPVDNGGFQVFIKAEILDAGADDLVYDDEMCVGKGCVPLDLVAANLCDGEAQFVSIPGELFPELAMGGFSQPLEWDQDDMENAPAGTPLKRTLKYKNAPLETPIRTEMMKAKYAFMIGLGNGELGYIVPKSQWDTDDYEETVSLGPETAPLLNEGLKKLFDLLP